MQSIAFSTSGTREPTVVDSRPTPQVSGDAVLVKVAASSINGSDINLRHGTGMMALITKRTSPGFDIAGQVVACGSQVTAFEVGDRVMGLLDHAGGGQAEFVAVRQHRLTVIPEAMSDADAAAIPLAGLTALQALRRHGRLQASNDSKVLINGAAGGIGSFAIQLARTLGAHVTAIAGVDRHDYLTGLGADIVVDRNDPQRFRAGQDFDLVLDVPGTLHFRDVRPALSAAGVHVSTRPITTDSARLVRIPFVSTSGPRYSAVTTSPSNQDLQFLARLVCDRRLTVPVDRTFPFADARAAYAHAEGGVRGKVVVTV